MIASRVWIDGFRRFEDQSIELEDSSTVLAGANNSGKTSLIDLLRIVFLSSAKVRADDFNASTRLNWARRLILAVADVKEDNEEEFGSSLAENPTPSIRVRITVEYDPALDDIRDFADYLMDLELSRSSFFFEYRITPDIEKLSTTLFPQIRTIKAASEQMAWSDANPPQVESHEFLGLMRLFDHALVESCRETVYFTDQTFETQVSMRPSDFVELFNFKAIQASRTLDDSIGDRSGALNKRLVDVAKESPQWADTLAGLPGLVLNAINETGIQKVTADETLKSLNTVIDSISKTNGGAQNDLSLDFQVTEDHAEQLISRAMQTRYLSGGVPLGEASQGLGYSNLILLHLETESFIRAVSSPRNARRVNLLVIEEPESHMHPQMQSAFIRHLLAKVSQTRNFQAVVTTHSSEIVRCSEMKQLRVLDSRRQTSKVVDLRQFHEHDVEKRTSEEQRLFNFLYSINFADVIFADKVVMYEGDTERMFIRALIENRADLSDLRAQYVSFVQVGGAYAHIYKNLIVDTLRIPTVVVTDIDYDKNSSPASVCDLEPMLSTNATLNSFFAPKNGGSVPGPTIGDLYGQVSPVSGVATVGPDEVLGVAFQSAVDGYGRTLEEAILATLLSCKTWETKTRQEWVKFRKESGLIFTIPLKGPDPSIRMIVSASASNKTDFMYSLMLRDGFHDEAPPYLLSALRWLNSCSN